MRLLPTVTGSGASETRMAGSTGRTTGVTMEEVLLAATKSPTPALTVLILVSDPSLGALTTIVTLAIAPLLIVPRLQATILPDRVQVPRVDWAETKLAAEGKRLVMTTAGAADGPW